MPRIPWQSVTMGAPDYHILATRGAARATLAAYPLLRLYQFTHAQTGETMYVAFEEGPVDIYDLLNVTHPVLLAAGGVLTHDGHQWWTATTPKETP